MRHLFEIDGRFYCMMTKAADLLVLNLLWMICSVPVFTAGAAVTALHDVTIQMAENREGYVAKEYLRSFQKNFRKGTVLWLLFLSVLSILLAVRTGMTVESEPVFIMCFFIGILCACIYTWVFPLLSQKDHTTVQLLRKSLFIGIYYFPYTLILFGGNAVLAYITFAYPGIILCWMFIGTALTAYGTAFIYRYILIQKNNPFMQCR
ncbi:hypothetical protein C808_04897 [Lachnospiraceae bacterium M18-1]|nr:hypothetical protein C808_04897 [Lachnospiraceae bacterium M18-1]